MEKLMEKPKNGYSYDNSLKDCNFGIYNFSTIRKFYDSVNEIWRIPFSLREKNWEPEKDNKYKVWWIHTNPSDPSDFGVEVILYIEEFDDSEQHISEIKNELISKFIEIVNNLGINAVYNLSKQLDIDLTK